MFNIAVGNPSFKPQFQHETDAQYSRRKKIAALATAIDTLCVTPLTITGAYLLEPFHPILKPVLFSVAGCMLYPAICAISECVQRIFNRNNGEVLP